MTSSLFEINKLPTILIILDYKRVAFVDALSSSQSPEELPGRNKIAVLSVTPGRTRRLEYYAERDHHRFRIDPPGLNF